MSSRGLETVTSCAINIKVKSKYYIKTPLKYINTLCIFQRILRESSDKLLLKDLSTEGVPFQSIYIKRMLGLVHSAISEKRCSVDI